MVGLSVLLESSSNKEDITKKTLQVISKSSLINMIKTPSPSPSPSSSSSSSSSRFNPFSRRSFSQQAASVNGGFLDHCFLCKQKLLPGRDIYMYKGDRGFCSEECRYRQIFMDDEEEQEQEEEEERRTTVVLKAKKNEKKCSFSSAIKPKSVPTSSSSSRFRKGNRNQANGFACS